ncbi:MAG: hypothetical protein IJ637_04465 [Prevotella sp.]|nr:hypothetical protein [Prevotella sp.]
MAKFVNKDAVFQKLASIADVASLNQKERVAYDENLRKYRDTIAVMEGQYLEGREEGREVANLENARKMKAKGYPITDIAEITGLAIKDIEAL